MTIKPCHYKYITINSTYCRFSAENVTWLADYFLNDCTETRGGALSPKMKMKIFLRCLANPGFQSGIAEELGVHQSTVSKVVTFVTTRVTAKVSSWIKFPHTEQDILQALEDWQNVNHFPGVIGVIDCTHIRIEKPGRHGDEYINRKGWPSINVQATCNAQDVTFIRRQVGGASTC